jgi:hypothetical protein
MATFPDLFNGPFQGGQFPDVLPFDDLICGRERLITETAILAQQSSVLPRGTLLGRISATGRLTVCKASAADGSQLPHSILVMAADATSGSATVSVYLKGEFNVDRVTIDASWGATPSAQLAALLAPCRAARLYLTALGDD